MPRRTRWWVAAGLLAAVAVASVAALYRGTVSVAADDRHWAMTARLLEFVRNRSIARHAADIAVPVFDDDMIASGAAHYDAMCTVCHLAPGIEESELRAGLNPQPPDLYRRGRGRTVAEQFWIVRHGLKMTGMPAWGRSHDDASLWAIVAFLQQLPGLEPDRYRELVAAGELRPHEHHGLDDAPAAGSQPPAPATHHDGHDHHPAQDAAHPTPHGELP